MLQVDALSFGYKKRTILTDISLNVHKGQMVSIVGPNGTGKTTLIKCLAGIQRPRGGSILINGKDAFGMHRREHARCVGYVPQSSPSKFPIIVFEAVLMGRRPYITWKPTQIDFEKTARVIESMNLKDIALRDFDKLSGGQKQKVMLARAIAQDTDVLLLDEPTSNLDLKHQLEVLEMISSLVETNQMAAVLAMHDLNLASRFSHRMVMMKEGQVLCSGTPSEVMTPENISTVYGIHAVVSQNEGHPYILPTGTVG
ncbi:ABC transporter ATP-binding protein [uncultured Desulfobacter sp.]|uniref:ABC transporter ATP-binding protein n=1 Tax=uncultured Desulfobacter sp. TaxID=240139 RepID=UPI0029F5BAA3|nr:ABC transporter ATP-binding protein [uncultured Desulfobacter sp.]